MNHLNSEPPEPPGTPNAEPNSATWALLEGAYDMHLHVAPDVIERRIDDLDCAREFLACGMKGFVLKSHYVPTGERAQVVTKAVPGIRAWGSVTLNHSVGGLNPVAVELAARSGCKVVWFPTVDAANETAGRAGTPPDTLPFWAAIQRDLLRQNLSPPPIAIIDDRGRLTEAAVRCVEVIARHDLILATGHIGRREIAVLVPEARRLGVTRIVVTHAAFPPQGLSGEEQRELAAQGAFVEHCFTATHTGKARWEDVFANIRHAGVERALISTDLGQTVNPPVAEGLALFAQRLLDAGFSRDEVRQMAVTTPTRLLEE